MSANDTSKEMKDNTKNYNEYIIAAIILIFLALFLIFGWILRFPNTSVQPIFDIMSDSEVISSAQALIERAEAEQSKVIDTANGYMAFVQTLMTALGILALFTFWSLRAEINKGLEEIKTVKAETQQKIEAQQKLNDSTDTKFKEIQAEIATQLNSAIYGLSLSQLAIRHVGMGNRVNAIEIFEEAREVIPDNPVILYFMGDLYLREGKVNEGMKLLEDALKKLSDSKAQNPELKSDASSLSIEASHAYGLRLMGDKPSADQSQKSCYSKSETAFENVYGKAPNLLDITGESAFGALASLYKKRGLYGDAVKYYEHCRTVTPHTSYPLNNLGILYYCYGRQLNDYTDKAEKTHRTAKEYFLKARDLLENRVKYGTPDYWPFFDLITAEVVLQTEDEGWLIINSYLDKALDRRPNEEAIGKFVGGLKELQEVKDYELKHIQNVLDRIDVYKVKIKPTSS